MHEMNGYWYPWSGLVNGNTPAKFIRAWRYIHKVFDAEGATNVTWVWTVNWNSVPNSTANRYGAYYPGDKYDFRLGDWKFIPVPVYSIPLRCLYSRNVGNLLMAGKHISVTHIAGSSTKTMLNGGQMGVAVAATAFLCKKHGATPREIGQRHIGELQEILRETGAYRDVFKPRKTH